MRDGRDDFLPPRNGRRQHTTIAVYTEMLLQVCRDYPGLPDPRTLEAHEIRFFYEGLRAELHRATAAKK